MDACGIPSNALFLLDSVQHITLPLAVLSPQSPLVCDGGPVFHILKGYQPIVLIMCPNPDLSDVFLMIGLTYGCWKEYQKPLHVIRRHMMPHKIASDLQLELFVPNYYDDLIIL